MWLFYETYIYYQNPEGRNLFTWLNFPCDQVVLLQGNLFAILHILNTRHAPPEQGAEYGKSAFQKMKNKKQITASYHHRDSFLSKCCRCSYIKLNCDLFKQGISPHCAKFSKKTMYLCLESRQYVDTKEITFWQANKRRPDAIHGNHSHALQPYIVENNLGRINQV